MKKVDTYTADIYCGLQPGYEKTRLIGQQKMKAEKICRDYCDKIGLGLTFTETKFIYTGGVEWGLIIGLINYPRFPNTPEKIKTTAIELTKLLKEELQQIRMSVVCSDETIMVGEE